MDIMALQVFENPQFGKVRIQIVKNEFFFCGKDVCDILGYKDHGNILKRNCKEKGMTKCQTLTNGGIQDLIFVNESNLYRLIVSSKMPKAQEFEEWIFEEVLPSIRKNGYYITGKTTVADIISPQDMIAYSQKMIEQCNQIIVLQAQVKEMKPKVIFADAVSISASTILVGDLAKLLKQNGIDIGAKRLFEWLRQNGYLMKNSSSKNMPTQKAMDLGLFEVIERTISKPDGVVEITRTTKVTGKGQIYFVNLFLNKVKAGNLDLMEAWENGFKI